MKQVKKKKTKKSGASASSKAYKKMRQRLSRMEAKAEGKGDGASDFDKLEQGLNWRWVLPSRDPDNEPYYFEAPVHFRIGPNNATVRCIGAACPICKKFDRTVAKINAKYKRGDPKGKKLWKEAANSLKAKNRFFMNVVDTKNAPDVVKVLGVGEMIMQSLAEYFFDPEYGDFTEPTAGRKVKIIRKGEKRETRYTTKLSPKITKLLNWEDLEPLLFDLEEKAGVIYTPAQIKQIMEGVEVDVEDDDDDDEDDDDLDLEDIDDDEDEDTDDDDEDDDDEDEDDEPPPRRKKKVVKKKASVTKKRLRVKARK